MKRSMGKSKRSKACDISAKVRMEVRQRDGDKCIWCGRHLSHPQICHYISRGAGGLGIPQNLTCGCVTCHQQADQGQHTDRYKLAMREHLKRHYPDWDETKLRYRKDG